MSRLADGSTFNYWGPVAVGGDGDGEDGRGHDFRDQTLENKSGAKTIIMSLPLFMIVITGRSFLPFVHCST